MERGAECLEASAPVVIQDISRCLLWTQRHHQTWPQIRTDILTKPIDLLMLNRLRDSYCEIKDGDVDAVAVVHSYDDGMTVGCHKTRLTALNVPPMDLFYPMLLVPDVYPPPPRSWFHDYEDMLEDTWHIEYPRRPEISDGLYPGISAGLSMWDNYLVFPSKPKKEEKVGLAEAVTSSILSTGRIDLKRKLFCSIQLIGGVALTPGLVPAVEERVLHSIPSNEAIDTVEVLQSRTSAPFVSWKGGSVKLNAENALATHWGSQTCDCPFSYLPIESGILPYLAYERFLLEEMTNYLAFLSLQLLTAYACCRDRLPSMIFTN